MLESKNTSDKVFIKYLQQCLAEIYEKQVIIKHTSYSGFDIYGDGEYLTKLSIMKQRDGDYLSTRFTPSWPTGDLINDHTKFIVKLKSSLIGDDPPA
jgi:hypothetical protein